MDSTRLPLDANPDSRRPPLDINLDSKTFREYYYLKTELVDFCRKNNLQSTGGKLELTDRIVHFLDTGERTCKNHSSKSPRLAEEISLDSLIEPHFVCSERHRAFYKSQIGPSFSFNVTFQKWLKDNPGKTYRDSIMAYRQILADKKQHKSPIDRQFEYNTYIRDFFAANPGKTLSQAIKCWKYKKSQKGHNKYDSADLKALEEPVP